jgi:Mce-associated membrane protein
MAIDADPADQKLEEQESEPTTEDPSEEPTKSDGPEHNDIEEDLDALDARRVGRGALAASLAIVVASAGVLGWLGYQAYQSHREQLRHNTFLQVARQGALNLTTINYTEAEADVQRVVDAATGSFRDDFKKRSQPFIDVVKQAQSKSQGSITEAAVESEQSDSAQVLVAVTVNTSLAGVAEQQPRAWRMRLTVQKIGDDTKVSNVEFVP